MMPTGLRARAATAALALLVGALPASASDVPRLDAFIGGLERGCRAGAALDAFRSDLNARYSFEEGHPRLTATVRIPPAIAAAVGRASAERHPTHTRIHVPLVGTYRGLRTRSIAFDIGHSNGVGVTTLAFAAPIRTVEAEIGPDVARTMQAFAADALEATLGLSARIVPAGEGAALVCDTSS
ncbi:hypothetical protein ASG52_00460 [Methylobacterium sp. Leaf456]|uniref:hypothetical protein n=1 Tax=Methylobacterium sp. Leaf456 TaxID=1736382 RepID=UPI0006F98878|nr:hypothetical protein [Methylobacterium sp. Leaf456]KQT61398.1 hypothetical protein ASG52_00460 [Methylobacterium sp. Leaf456]